MTDSANLRNDIYWWLQDKIFKTRHMFSPLILITVSDIGNFTWKNYVTLMPRFIPDRSLRLGMIYLVWESTSTTHVAPVTINHSRLRRESAGTAVKHLITHIIRPINIHTFFHGFFFRFKGFFTPWRKWYVYFILLWNRLQCIDLKCTRRNLFA